MNTRARNRLIGVTVIILAIAAAVLFSSNVFTEGASYARSVSEATSDPSLIGKRVKVTGSVVAGSWDKRSNPMVFRMRETTATGGPEIKVVYTGGVPNTFGNGSVPIVTGTLEQDGSIRADDMLVTCPTKYATSSASATIAELKAKPGIEMRVGGILKPGSLKDAAAAERFILSTAATAGDEVPVVFEGALPDGVKDGAGLVVLGKYETGKLVATNVSLVSPAK
jgi:cytochrome c-type biogenesis protein CcmE